MISAHSVHTTVCSHGINIALACRDPHPLHMFVAGGSPEGGGAGGDCDDDDEEKDEGVLPMGGSLASVLSMSNEAGAGTGCDRVASMGLRQEGHLETLVSRSGRQDPHTNECPQGERTASAGWE